MRESQDAWLAAQLMPMGWRREGRQVDLISRDGARCVEVVAGAQGIRELDATALRMARWLIEQASRQGCIVLLGPRLSKQRLVREWGTIRELVRQDVGKRMALVVEGFGEAVGTSLPWVRQIAELTRTPKSRPPRPNAHPAAMSPTVFQVLKLVLRHWLLKTGPLSRRRLQVESGATYPTVARALRKLEEFGELDRTTDRRVQLRAFPRKTWQEMLSLAPSLRHPRSFIDATGRRPDLIGLLKRLEALRPPGIALGGVQSARSWDRRFDLNGLPRLDVVAHAPHGSYDASFVGRLDSALRDSPSPSAEHVLVIHALPRAEALFHQARPGKLPYADPVETLLDLEELRLSAQADELIARLASSPGE